MQLDWSNDELEWMEEIGLWPECKSSLMSNPMSACSLCLGSGNIFPVPFTELLPENGD